jgi:hypothetical protein
MEGYWVKLCLASLPSWVIPKSTLNGDFASISRPASTASPALSRAFLADPELWDRSVDTASSLRKDLACSISAGVKLRTPARKRTERFWRWAPRKLAFVKKIHLQALTDVQSGFVNDSKIELRLGIASFGGFK